MAATIRPLTQRRHEPMQRFGGDLAVLHHRDTNVVFSWVGAVGLVARRILAGQNPQACFFPKLQSCSHAAALRRNIEPEEESAGGSLVAVAVADDLVGEVELGAIERLILLDMGLVV